MEKEKLKKYERVAFLTVWYKTRSPEVRKFLELKWYFTNFYKIGNDNIPVHLP